jgi:hypothetical protein
MFIIFITILFLIVLVFLIYKNKKRNHSIFQTKTDLDKIAHINMSCKVLKRVMRPDLGAGIFVNIVEDSCYDGLPHTTDKININIPLSLYEKGGNDLDHVLEHECIHIMQRRDIYAWKQMYARFKWAIYSKIPFSDMNEELISLLKRVRENPDISNEKYGIWNKRYLFLSCYKNVYNPKVRESEMIIYDLYEKKVLKGFPPDYYDWMKINQADHPHEIFAELLSDKEKYSQLNYGVQNFFNLQKKKLFVD